MSYSINAQAGSTNVLLTDKDGKRSIYIDGAKVATRDVPAPAAKLDDPETELALWSAAQLLRKATARVRAVDWFGFAVNSIIGLSIGTAVGYLLATLAGV